MLREDKAFVAIEFSGHRLYLLASGGCYWPAKKALIVSDLHLEKGSYFALRGSPLPLTDTRDTLENLKLLVQFWQPETVLCLGDNTHDAEGLLRMDKADLQLLSDLSQSVSSWQWVLGNHDVLTFKSPFLKGLHLVPEVFIDNLCFTHEPYNNKPYQLIGHYHPKVAVRKKGVRLSGKCFIVTDDKIILPAFGSYTGGLDICDKVYNDFLKGKRRYYLMFKDKLYQVA